MRHKDFPQYEVLAGNSPIRKAKVVGIAMVHVDNSDVNSLILAECVVRRRSVVLIEGDSYESVIHRGEIGYLRRKGVKVRGGDDREAFLREKQNIKTIGIVSQQLQSALDQEESVGLESIADVFSLMQSLQANSKEFPKNDQQRTNKYVENIQRALKEGARRVVPMAGQGHFLGTNGIIEALQRSGIPFIILRACGDNPNSQQIEERTQERLQKLIQNNDIS